MEEEYYGQCDNCDVSTQVLVMDEEEVPLFCPMCGCQMEYESDS